MALILYNEYRYKYKYKKVGMAFKTIVLNTNHPTSIKIKCSMSKLQNKLFLLKGLSSLKSVSEKLLQCTLIHTTTVATPRFLKKALERQTICTHILDNGNRVCFCETLPVSF